MADFAITPEAFKQMRASPIVFVYQVWGLLPQPVRKEYAERYFAGLALKGKEWDAFCASLTPDWFAPYINGKHLTWQQSLVLHGIEKAVRGEVSPRISIVSGHGIGKSAISAIVVLWFLFARLQSKVACTAPSADQMYDVLWSEIKKWLDKMPPQIAANYIWETTHLRMREDAQAWWARAKTSNKENTEALAGIHADSVLMLADEASGIEEQIYETMEGALTGEFYLVFLVSNGTRSTGYFYDTHHKDSARWQCYSFSALQSPITNDASAQGWKDKYGEESEQYAIRVLGKFPPEGEMDTKGYMPLFLASELKFTAFDRDWQTVGRTVGSLDPSGEGQDESAWAVKDRMRAAIVGTEATSSDGGMAVRSLTVCTKYGVKPEDFIIDAFGAGHKVAQEIALATAKLPVPWRVTPLNTGEPCDKDSDHALYINKRAMGYWLLSLWVKKGGELMYVPGLKDELLSIKFRRTGNGRIQIMSKLDMKKMGLKSPNKADALSMLFLAPEDTGDEALEQRIAESRQERTNAQRVDSGMVA